MNDFIDRNIDSPLNLITPNLARLIALGGFRRLAPKVNQFLKDPLDWQTQGMERGFENVVSAGSGTQPGVGVPMVLISGRLAAEWINALHGKTYSLATLLPPKAKRPFVHALYGFARYTDEIVPARTRKLPLFADCVLSAKFM